MKIYINININTYIHTYIFIYLFIYSGAQISAMTWCTVYEHRVAAY